MNVLFPLLFLFSTLICLCLSPENFLPVLLSGAENAAHTTVALLAAYTLFSGLSKVMEESGICDFIASLLRPIIRLLFKVEDRETTRAIAMNLSGNMLGISSLATPMGQRAASLLAKGKDVERGHTLLFVINATSIQLLPTTVLSLLAQAGAKNPYSILLPSILSTGFSTLLGVGMAVFAYTMPVFKRKNK